MAKVIGKVSATEKYPSTIDEFYFWTDKKQILSPFDVVKVNHESGSITYGVVEEINHITDAPSHFILVDQYNRAICNRKPFTKCLLLAITGTSPVVT